MALEPSFIMGVSRCLCDVTLKVDDLATDQVSFTIRQPPLSSKPTSTSLHFVSEDAGTSSQMKSRIIDAEIRAIVFPLI